MKYSILCFLFTCTLSNALRAQSATDTLMVDAVQKLNQLSQCYSLPGDSYTLDHFVAFFSLPGNEPYAVYNRGNDFEPGMIENASKLTSGCKLSIQVYAKNSETPDVKPVKLPRKDFYIK